MNYFVVEAKRVLALHDLTENDVLYVSATSNGAVIIGTWPEWVAAIKNAIPVDTVIVFDAGWLMLDVAYGPTPQIVSHFSDNATWRFVHVPRYWVETDVTWAAWGTANPGPTPKAAYIRPGRHRLTIRHVRLGTSERTNRNFFIAELTVVESTTHRPGEDITWLIGRNRTSSPGMNQFFEAATYMTPADTLDDLVGRTVEAVAVARETRAGQPFTAISWRAPTTGPIEELVAGGELGPGLVRSVRSP